jgi:hypothetical protein
MEKVKEVGTKPMPGIIRQTLRDFFSPVANFKYIVSAVKGTLPPEDHRGNDGSSPSGPQ